jgi:fatty acid desaturase (delta-4 desaturase)
MSPARCIVDAQIQQPLLDGCPVVDCGVVSVKSVNGEGNLDRCPIGSFRVPNAYKTHPGGQAALKAAADSKIGADSSATAGILFLSYHIGRDLDGKIASVAKMLGCTLPERGPIYDEIHEATRRIKADHPLQHNIFVAWCLLITVAFLLAFPLWILQPTIFNSCATMVLFELYFFNIFHTRHHKSGKLFEISALDNLTTPLYDFIDCTWGVFPPAWLENHQLRHHLHTNDLKSDPDLPDTHPLVRMSEDQPKYWYNKFQTFYWPLLLPFSVVRFPIQNVFGRGGSVSSFVCWLLLMFYVPYYVNGYVGVAHSCFVQGLTGVFITYKFSVSHTHGNLGNDETGEVASMRNIDDWLKAQVEESMSWGGYISCFLFGGIGMQIEHHVCPALDPPLYYFLAPELRQICEKHGIRYTSEPTMFHAALQFHKQLWRMG